MKFSCAPAAIARALANRKSQDVTQRSTHELSQLADQAVAEEKKRRGASLTDEERDAREKARKVAYNAKRREAYPRKRKKDGQTSGI